MGKIPIRHSAALDWRDKIPSSVKGNWGRFYSKAPAAYLFRVLSKPQIMIPLSAAHNHLYHR
jgi:hypothetical protein